MYESLSAMYRDMHESAIREGRWTWFSEPAYFVNWVPWGIWKPIGYTPSKLTQLVNQSIDPDELARTHVRLDRVMNMYASSDVYTVAMQFGRHTAGKIISPLRYKLGACLSTVIFRVYKGRHYPPLVIWRTTEITRRLIADWALLDNLWRWVGMDADSVQMQFGSIWLANFNLQVAGQLMPYLPNTKYCPVRWKRLFFPAKNLPTYKARAIAWNVAKGIKHAMWNRHGILWGGYKESDFPKLEMPT